VAIEKRMSDRAEDNYLPLQKERSSGGGGAAEMLSSEMQKAQERLLSLQRQQEQIEKQKRELEELTRKEEEFEEGKEEMVEKFTRALVIVERQTFEVQKQLEQLRATQKNFTEHLRTLEGINPASWSKSELDKAVLQRELSKALTALDQARALYGDARSRISVEMNEDVLEEVEEEMAESGGMPRSFGEWVVSGFAFTLPLSLLGVAALIVWIMRG